MRPAAVGIFEQLYFATIAIGVVQIALSWDQLMRVASVGFVISVQLGTLAVIVVLILLVSRRRSNIAKWIMIVLFAIGLPGLYKLFAAGLVFGSTIVMFVQTLMQLVALALLFTPAARAWFSAR